MKTLLLIAIGSAIVNNVVLSPVSYTHLDIDAVAKEEE